MTYEREPSLRDAVDLLRRGFWWALAAALIGGTATYLLTSARAPVYQAVATVVTTSQDPAQRAFGSTLVTAPALSTATYRAAVVSRPVLALAVETMTGVPPSDEDVLGLGVAVSVRSEEASASALLRISARAADPAEAVRRADAVARALVRWDAARATRSLETIVDSLLAQIVSIDAEIGMAEVDQVGGLERARADLALQLSSARALRTGAVGRTELFEGAILPGSPISPSPLRDALIVGLLAMIAAYGLQMVRAALDNRIGNLDELITITNLPMFASFPRVPNGRRGLPREAASFLRTGVAFATMNAHPKILLVTSSTEAEGKSSVSIALATAFARQHYRTLLIDADLRKPTIGREFGLDPKLVETFRDALRENGKARASRIALAPGEWVDVLPSFEPARDPTELLSAYFPAALKRVAGDYDIVVIDSAPVLPVADALIMAPHTSGVVFVASIANADRRAVIKAIALMRRLGIQVVGTVATNVPSAMWSGGTAGFGYGYGSGPSGASAAPSTEPERPGAAAERPPRPRRSARARAS